ncbi:hypothetical protein [Paracoccus spongiarum]|uniref:PNPLA domain-containing protein n=1 Tax=Paracoccus spongiarum TaxID=3064387 RepID=A0ABT9J791_9RHOB|nr:hypothetical protein [Paracoccus sp. 2205BS29-5]MDP5305682.1 hypothetical protein [Paracoccus sp. 2205BS29-5]
MNGRPSRKPTDHASFSEEFGDALEYGWGPILVSVLFSLALAVPDPAHEALMSLAENALRSGAGAVTMGATVLAFFFLPPTLHLFTRFALETPRHFGPHAAWIEAVLTTWVGRLPLLAVVVAVLRVLAGGEASGGARILLALLALVAGLFAISGIWVFLTPGFRARLGPLRDRAVPRLPHRPLHRLYRLIRDAGTSGQRVAALSGAAVLAAVAAYPPIAELLGPISVVILFVVVAAMALALLTRLSSRLCYGQVPLVFLVLGMVWAGTGLTGTLGFLLLAAIYAATVFIYPARTTPPERATAAVALLVAAGMLSWGLYRRDDCPALAGCHVIRPTETGPAVPALAAAYPAWRAAMPGGQPLRLIAAEGGGIFAAYYTALYLAKRADAEGAGFARSVLAISGVSGGSVGAAVFWAILRAGDCAAADAAPDCHQQKARQILGRDYLSPVIAVMLTTDLIDKALPLSSALPQRRIERGRQLERSLIRHADAALLGASGLDAPLADSWDADAGLPALFLNATRVSDGRRQILSPFGALAGDSSDWPNPQMAGAGLPVATAAFVSARFPLVTAAARLATPDGIRQIVDGGYFDNSGMETINDILEVLKSREGAGTGPVEVIALTTRPPAPGAEAALKGSLGTPLSAFLGAWKSRLEMVRERMKARWRDRAVGIALFQLPMDGINYTLSWYLDRNSLCGIERNLNRSLQGAGPGKAALSLPEGCAQP